MSIGEEMMHEAKADDAYLRLCLERALADGTWITRDGAEIPVREMDDAHLANSIRMVRRGGKGCFGCMSGEALAMLENEARRRGLEVGA